MKNNEKAEKLSSEKLIENVDYYFENGSMVLTAHFLKKRGCCCRNGCRHCPYSNEKDKL
jgi:Family of unknown function (DUF5522)